MIVKTREKGRVYQKKKRREEYNKKKYNRKRWTERNESIDSQKILRNQKEKLADAQGERSTWRDKYVVHIS